MQVHRSTTRSTLLLFTITKTLAALHVVDVVLEDNPTHRLPSDVVADYHFAQTKQNQVSTEAYRPSLLTARVFKLPSLSPAPSFVPEQSRVSKLLMFFTLIPK